MRDYGKIAPRFWIGDTGKQLRGCTQAQVVAIYLMSSPHANMIGLYYLPKSFITHETGLTIEGASKGLRRCIEAQFCAYNEDSEMVWVFEMARFQIAEQLKVDDKRCKGIQNEYDGLPENPFLPTFFDKYAGRFHLSSRRQGVEEKRRGFEGASKVHRSQEQEQEQEKRYMVRAAPEAKPDDCHFDAFWQSYPRKVAKDGARKAWAKIRPDEPTVAAIFSALTWQRGSESWRKNGGQFVPHPSTWLNNRRWEDERPANGPDEEPDPYRDFRKVVPCHNPNCPEPPDMRAHWEGDVCPGSEQHA